MTARPKLSGTPAAGSAGKYTLMLLAKNAAGEVRQTFTLNAGTAPVFSSIPPLVFREGVQKTVTIAATGAPPPAIRLDAGSRATSTPTSAHRVEGRFCRVASHSRISGTERRPSAGLRPRGQAPPPRL
jgi:hypothetical protein